MSLTDGPGPRHLPRWHLTESKYLTHLKNSQIKFESDDLMQIGTCCGVKSNQKSKVNLLVVSPPLNGRRRRPATWPNMAGRWCTMRARYKMLEEDRRGSGGPVAHRDTPEVVGVEDCCRNWSWLRRFRWSTAKRIGGFRAIETSPPRFNPPGDPRRRGGALGLVG
jgi:hypothetical protein